MANYEEGYEDHRFEKEVERNLHCPICLNVLRDPVQCRRNQHLFCSPCIKRHLQQYSETCPTCREDLTAETLLQPPRVAIEWLSTLKIRCDFAARGCRELIELGFLKRHVEDCGYSPTNCENDGCSMINLNKRDKEHHENNVCCFRKLMCDDCGKELVYHKFKTHGCTLKKEIDEVKMNLTEVKEQLGMMRHQIKCNQEEIMQEVREMTSEMKEFMINATVKVNEVKDEMKGVKQTIRRLHSTRGNIVVAGGHDEKPALNSVETFSWLTKTWEPRQSMKQQRCAASLFVYQEQIFVAGGFNGVENLDSLERLNMDEVSGQSLNFDAKLPVKLLAHTSVVYQNNLIVTGGDTHNGFSDSIYEIRLTPQLRSSKLLCKMPQPRAYHCSQLFKNKILTFGGAKTMADKDSYDSVLLYNITTNKCEQKAPLPFAVNSMASVSWNDDVILMGGIDENGNMLNTVVKYDVKTGKSELLPPMKYRRSNCAAVVTGNVIVVIGGTSNAEECLNSVEYFDFGRYVWEELPPMIKKRSRPVAAVKPVA